MSLYISGPSSRGHMVLSGGDAADEDASRQKQQKQSPRTGTSSHSAEEGSGPPITPKKEAEEPDTGVHRRQSDREGSLPAITREEVLQTPDSGGHAMHSGQLEKTPSAIREKVLDDGYNWRKYGQKNVKGNEFIRSYYRCTHPNCQVKKQLERSHDGRITDTVYFGQHNHPKPQQNLPLAVGFAVSILEKRDEKPLTKDRVQDKSLNVQPLRQIAPKNAPQLSSVLDVKNSDNAQQNSNKIKDEVDDDNHPNCKRQKKNNYNVEAIPVNNHAGQPRIVVQTVSEVDFVNDGYRWRKYGQKLVKGNPNPRSYYRCSSPGCPVKKHVERASDDPQTVITTYEGQHDHDMPPSRTVTPKTTGPNTSATAHSGESSAKSKENEIHGFSMVGHPVLVDGSKAVKHQNGKSSTKLEETEVVDSEIAIQSSSAHEIIPNEHIGKLGAESKPNEQQNGVSSGKDDVVDSNMSAHASTGLDSGSSEQLNGKSRESNAVDVVVHVRAGYEGNSSEQQRPNSEPVKS